MDCKINVDEDFCHSRSQCRAVRSLSLQTLAYWDRRFEFRRGHVCLSVESVVCCQAEVSATCRFLVQRSRTECVCDQMQQ